MSTNSLGRWYDAGLRRRIDYFIVLLVRNDISIVFIHFAVFCVLD